MYKVNITYDPYDDCSSTITLYFKEYSKLSTYAKELLDQSCVVIVEKENEGE